MSLINEKCLIPESSGTTNSNIDVAEKFRLYRMDAESTERKFKNASEMIERLKEEINFSRDSEKNLRNQLSSAQNRLIHLQEALKKIIVIFGRVKAEEIKNQQRQTEKVSQQIEQKVEKIGEEIKRIREESQILLQRTSREVDLLKEIENLKSIFAKKTRESDLMNMEIQTLKKEKDEVMAASQQKLRNLESELENLKQRQMDAEAHYGETLKYYQEQLEEKDKTIKIYEKERKSFLDDFEPLRVSQVEFDSVKHADDSISIKPSNRVPKSAVFEDQNSQRKQKEYNADISRRSQSEKRSSHRKVESQNHPKEPKKQKPPLDFLIPSESSSQNTISVRSDRKRRLFSSNSNYYMD